ncbi:MAG: Mn-dependent transcriptional regulator MntR [Anaerolineae bacterium]|jgi:DtxR family Mn-dependent transcriptional regulator|nr:MAG: Mn-dependent transcriptional regulator MntR [Anaerolineae bacterium]
MRIKLDSKAFEDYLKIIYDLSQSNKRVSTQQIADRLKIAPASVTGMLKRMAANKPPLVDYRKHQGVKLTLEGKQAALEVIRHHRLLETYLVARLGYTWDTVHDEACQLEHVISEEFEERIAALLGDPKFDPHGEPIPAADLSMPPQVTTRLSTLKPHQSARIARVSATNSELLRYLGALGLMPGTTVDILNVSPFDGNITLIIEGIREAPHVLGNAITDKIFVEQIEDRVNHIDRIQP